MMMKSLPCLEQQLIICPKSAVTTPTSLHCAQNVTNPVLSPPLPRWRNWLNQAWTVWTPPTPLSSRLKVCRKQVPPGHPVCIAKVLKTRKYDFYFLLLLHIENL
uniref:Uncharacterized protein n=1 Tax=Cacopsylla melanoneura TaxID=428564 RepID=A0A8D8LXP4_9HEMI